MTNNEKLRMESEQDTDPRVDLAVERTELAWDRTQLAWIRTCLGFIGSGIALDKGMEAIHNSRIVSGTAIVKNAHFIGLTLSMGGTLLMIFTTWLFIRRMRILSKMKGKKPILLPSGALASFLIILLGVVVCLLLGFS